VNVYYFCKLIHGLCSCFQGFPLFKKQIIGKKLPSENIFDVLRIHQQLKMAASKLVQHGDRFDNFGEKTW